MGQNTRTASAEAEKAVKDIRRRTRKRYSTEDKIRIILAGLRGEDSIAKLVCMNPDALQKATPTYK